MERYVLWNLHIVNINTSWYGISYNLYTLHTLLIKKTSLFKKIYYDYFQYMHLSHFVLRTLFYFFVFLKK